jgi:hypothetical protein
MALNTIEFTLGIAITVVPALNVPVPLFMETASPTWIRSNAFAVALVTEVEVVTNVQFATKGVKVKPDPLALPATVGAVVTVIWVELITDATVVAAIVAPPGVDNETKSPARILVNPFNRLVLMFTLFAVRVQPDTTKNTGVKAE